VPADEPGNAGFHVVEVTEAKPTKQAIQLAVLEHRVAPSIETERALYADASKFASANNKGDAFKAASKEYNPRQAEGIQKNTHTVPGLGSARDLVKWVFESPVNSVSDVFTLDNRYVVVMVTKVQKEGTATVDDVRTEVEIEVKKAKKADLLKAKMTGTDLNAIASATGKMAAPATGMSLNNSFVPGVGNESSVVGKALSLNAGETATGIVGENGVFAIKVNNKNTPPALTDATAQKKQLAQSAESRVDFMLPESIRKGAEVEDQRFKFY
jgi:peptidyl-prolyl cis-trans isomerase D